MEDTTKERGAQFAMPVRKLATLPYPFEQLHGRSAALAERLAQLYVEKFVAKDATYMATSLLTKPKGTRGRPPVNKDAAPRRSLAQFWQNESMDFGGRFQLLPIEKPQLVLDNASNIDAIKNLLLGIRLLQYNIKPKAWHSLSVHMKARLILMSLKKIFVISSSVQPACVLSARLLILKRRQTAQAGIM